jgi:hypothetical protein
MNTKRKTGIRVEYTSTAIVWHDIENAVPSITVNVDELADSIKRQGLFHGIDQKVTDAGAMGTDHWDGEDKPKRVATTAERMARMRRVADTLAAGEWNTRRSSDPLAGKSAAELEALIAAAKVKLAGLGI